MLCHLTQLNETHSNPTSQSLKRMKLLIQRVLSASVSVEGTTISAIGPGLLILIGINRSDTPAQAISLARKLLKLRLWPSASKTWDLSVIQKGYELLLVSQFTLQAVLKGNKPDFHQAMNPESALELFELFTSEVRANSDPSKVQTGCFGQYMSVSLSNDGQ